MRKLQASAFLALLGSGITVAYAAENGVRISEVMWDGTEYVELYNGGDEEVRLEGWKLSRQKAGTDEQTIITFTDDHRIDAGDYFLIEKNQDATSIEADAIASSLTLVNTGEAVRLYDDKNNTRDSAGGEGAWLAGKNTDTGVSMERTADGWQSSSGAGGGRSGTPRAANSSGQAESSTTPVPQSYDTPLLINEFLPNPSGEDAASEFIELYNPSDGSVDLSGWQIDDASGGSTPYRIPDNTSVASHSYIVFKSTDTKIALNNTNDSVRLLDPTGGVQEETSYTGGPENQSYNRDTAGSYKLSTTITSGNTNVITQPAPSPAATPKATSTPTVKPSPIKTASPTSSVTGIANATIVIWRLLPDPVEKDEEGEYIEVKNKESKSVTLTGWKLDDEEGGSTPYEIPEETTIAAGQIISFPREETNIALNNTGDTVRLLNPAGVVVDQITYGKVGAGEIVSVESGSVAGATTTASTTSAPVSSDSPTVSTIAKEGESSEGVEVVEGIPQTQVALAGASHLGQTALVEETSSNKKSQRDGIVAGVLLIGGAGAAAVAYAKPGTLAKLKSFVSNA
ncbi:MAG: lamin tail domain-containing protein [Candidatus Andersenbacteria bacterium]|nr:lamin tail domain-containing protein [Candidatus Andersenbacteria bacterium]MBI3250777.1 lamin tail domain-containing protein [Candidatus Andersenbacteria bacterium]